MVSPNLDPFPQERPGTEQLREGKHAASPKHERRIFFAYASG